MSRPRPPIEQPLEIASLPADDPLRRALVDEEMTPELAQACALADAEEPRLRAELQDVAVPDFERRLLDVARARPRRLRVAAMMLAAAAALVMAFAIGRWTARDPEVDPAVVALRPKAPEVVAIKFWHVTCPGCKVLDPRYAAVVDEFEDDAVLFVTFDMSTEFSRRQSALLASVLGVRDIYDEVFGSSGFVLLIDADTRARIGQLTAKQDEEEMKGSIRDAIQRSRS
jgi:hypothetical protein